MKDAAVEVNFDALVGPTHNYAGLACGNLASQRSKLTVSNPKAAALEGLAKMKLLADLGVQQAVLPPQERPHVATLRQLGFTGDDSRVLEAASRSDPTLLAACCSASSMWAANAATISPSADTVDGRVHLTPANLCTQFHRSLETTATAAILQKVFPDPALFAHHPPLPATPLLPDDGAANHMRLAPEYRSRGLEVFVYGRGTAGAEPEPAGPTRFPARQSLQASQAIARLHGVRQALFIQQNPAAIDAGVFHNDVIAVSNLNVLLCHERAFLEGSDAARQIASRYREACGDDLQLVVIGEGELSLAEGVDSYLFNSQLVSLPGGGMALVAPTECLQYPAAERLLKELPARCPGIRHVHCVPVRQSMANGGGPACLRLRVVLTAAELAQARRSVFLDANLYDALCSWVTRYYREKLAARDLADPHLLEESRRALDELTQILHLGSHYAFQQTRSR